MYLDPGAASVIVQAVIAGVVGVWSSPAFVDGERFGFQAADWCLLS